MYINPDVKHPFDKDRGHSDTYQDAERICSYYQIPLTYRAINYRPTQLAQPYFWEFWKKSPGKDTPLDTVDIASLSLIDFGFGVSRGGNHVWLFSKGDVYEVHWGSYRQYFIRGESVTEVCISVWNDCYSPRSSKQAQKTLPA